MLSSGSLTIKGFLETSFMDWPGKICSVIFFPYCNFRCCYCHNAALVLEPESLATIDVNDILSYLSKNTRWIDGVCVTGGEPTLQESLPLLLSELHQRGFLVKLDTNGSNPEVLQSLIGQGLVDYIAMDVKAALEEESYCAITGSVNTLVAVKKSIRLIIASGIEHEFRCTVLPRFHQPEEIVRLARELNGAKRFRLQNFNPHQTLDPELSASRPYDEHTLQTLQQEVNAALAGAFLQPSSLPGTA